jgi:hypothetical protein
VIVDRLERASAGQIAGRMATLTAPAYATAAA